MDITSFKKNSLPSVEPQETQHTAEGPLAVPPLAEEVMPANDERIVDQPLSASIDATVTMPPFPIVDEQTLLFAETDLGDAPRPPTPDGGDAAKIIPDDAAEQARVEHQDAVLPGLFTSDFPLDAVPVAEERLDRTVSADVETQSPPVHFFQVPPTFEPGEELGANYAAPAVGASERAPFVDSTQSPGAFDLGDDPDLSHTAPEDWIEQVAPAPAEQVEHPASPEPASLPADEPCQAGELPKFPTGLARNALKLGVGFATFFGVAKLGAVAFNSLFYPLVAHSALVSAAPLAISGVAAAAGVGAVYLMRNWGKARS